MRPAARLLFSVFVRYMVRFLRTASARREAAHGARTSHAAPTYPVGSSRPAAFAAARFSAQAPSTESLCGRIGQCWSRLPISSQ